MKDLLFRKLKMYLNVLSVLKNFMSVWVSSLPFKTEVDAFASRLDLIDAKSRSLQGTQGVSENKKQMSRELMDATLVVCGAGTAYASQIKNNELKTKFNFNKSDLLEGNEKDFYHRCVNISEAAEAIKDNLQGFNLPPNHLEHLKITATAYNQLINAPREAIKAGKSTHEEVESLYDECDLALDERLDMMMLIYKKSHPDFFTEYTNARHIGGWSKGKEDENEGKV